MTNNKIGLNLGDLVLANGIEGEVIGVGADSGLIKLPVVIDGQVKLVQQWYDNDALKKIEVNIGVIEVETDAEVVMDTPTIEMGVPSGSEPIKKINNKKTNKKKDLIS